MINNIVLVGRTTKAIELKQNKNGTSYVQFTLAVNRPYKVSFHHLSSVKERAKSSTFTFF